MHRPLDYSIADLNRLHDRAHADALAIRRQAMDDFWHDTDGLLGAMVDRMTRMAGVLRQAVQRRRSGPDHAKGCAHAGC